MYFRDMKIDDVFILENLSKNILETKIIDLCRKYNVIDLQFSTVIDDTTTFHSVLALVQYKKEE